MEKKIYLRPLATEELFTPNEYCSACRDKENQRVWEAQCRTQAEGSCLIFFDDNDFSSDACRGGCGGKHTFTGSAIPKDNCWLLVNVRDGSGSGSSNINSHRDWFSSIGSNGVGYVIKPEMVQTLKDRKELVRGYYNDHVLDKTAWGQPWLVTAALADIHPLFS